MQNTNFHFPPLFLTSKFSYTCFQQTVLTQDKIWTSDYTILGFIRDKLSSPTSLTEASSAVAPVPPQYVGGARRSSCSRDTADVAQLSAAHASRVRHA